MTATYKVAWLRLALRDLEDIASYIAQEDEEAARKVVKEVWRAAQTLRKFPDQARPGKVPGTRELVLKGLPFFYCLSGKGRYGADFADHSRLPSISLMLFFAVMGLT